VVLRQNGLSELSYRYADFSHICCSVPTEITDLQTSVGPDERTEVRPVVVLIKLRVKRDGTSSHVSRLAYRGI
jgi:hypothetical protein